MLEHIPYRDLTILLQECLRVLVPGGSFSVCVPSVKMYIDSYNRGASMVDFSTCFEPAFCDTGSLVDQLNYTAYMGGEHHYMFDEENIVKIMLQAGFENVHLREFDPQLDMPERQWESLYAIAYKAQ
jgi:hypothetical protein